MLPNGKSLLLCNYRYDAQNRLVNSTPMAQATTRQRFYMKERLATEIQGVVQRSIMQHGDQLLAEQQHQGATVKSTLLATGQQRSVLSTLDTTPPRSFTYTPYGHRIPGGVLLSLLGFNGERPDPVTGWYLLGNGYRAFNPVLMRFNSPGSWSPFWLGGMNPYTYCGDEPINREDRTGHAGPFLERIVNAIFPSRARAIGTARNTVQPNRSALSTAAIPSRNTTPTPANSLPPPYVSENIKSALIMADESLTNARNKNYTEKKLHQLKQSKK